MYSPSLSPTVFTGRSIVLYVALLAAVISLATHRAGAHLSEDAPGLDLSTDVLHPDGFADTPLSDAVRLAEAAKAEFGLTDVALVSLGLPDELGTGFELDLSIDGEALTLMAWAQSVRSPNYKLLVQKEGGAIVEETPSPELTYRGVVIEYSGSAVAGSLLEEGLVARIMLPDGRQYWIEPMASKFAGVDRSLHALYRSEDVIPSGGTCAAEGAGTDPGDGEGTPRGSACGTGMCFAEIANDADYEYFLRYNSNVASTENRISLITNTMNIQYERDVDITHVISSIVVRTNINDPYTSSNASTLLNQFRTEWNNNMGHIPRDVATLYTGRDIDGSTIGIAFVGVICGSSAYGVCQTDCCGSLACASDLHAHEVGHNWGANHCDPCSGTTMQSSLQCSNVFAASSISAISTHRDSRTCLSDAGSTFIPPFFDDFPSTTLDSTKWTAVGGAINTTGNGEPSPPYSFNIDGSDRLTSVPINLSASNNGSISYWWQRTGGGDSPEPGEDLLVEYLSNQNVWVLLATHPGAGSDTDPYQFQSFALPEDAKHLFFRIRFRGTSTSTNGTDDFFIDDILVDPGDISPPTPNPMNFSVFPEPAAPNVTSSLFMEAIEAQDEVGPIEYYFERTNGPVPDSNSGWQTSRTWVTTGLNPNTPYNHRVKARDGNAIPNETAFSTNRVGYTAIQTPTGVSASNISGSSFTLTALGTFTALINQQSGLFFEVKDSEGVPVGNNANVWTVSSSSTSINVTGLLPGRNYSVRVKARNRVALETEFTSTINVSTLDLVTPNAPILSEPTDASMVLTIDTNNNPPATQYAIQCQATNPADPNWTGKFVRHVDGQPVASEDWQTAGSPITLTNLQFGTQYTFRVKARNVALQESAYSPSSSLSTGPLNIPGAPSLTNATSTTLELAINTNNNASTIEFAIQCTSTTPFDSDWAGRYVVHANGTPAATEDWQTAGSPITVTNLKPSVVYQFAVKARTPTATSVTGLGPAASRATLALVPGTLVVGAYPLITAILAVTPDDDPVLNNSIGTQYAIFCIDSTPQDPVWTGMYLDADGNPSANETWRTSAQWGQAPAVGLRVSTDYSFVVKARNQENVQTGFGGALLVSTGTDCNLNQISDAKELAECLGNPACSDCNNNGILDACDVGTSGGQWASTLIDFSTQYDAILPSYGAIQTLGPSNVVAYGDSIFAWAPSEADDGLQHVTVGVDTHVHATGVVVRESYNNGFVVLIEVVRVDNVLIEVWPLDTGQTDNTPPNVIADFTATWPETPYLVKGVRVTIDTTHVLDDWEEIDSIRLLGRAAGTVADDNENGVPDSCEVVDAPAAPLLSNPTLTGMDLSLAPDANPPGSEYAIRCVGTDPEDTTWSGQYVDAFGQPSPVEVWRTATAWDVISLGGMTPGTEYAFSAKARLFVGVESPFGPSAALSTLPIPTGACCYISGDCTVLTETDCDAQDGGYFGDGTSCDPNPCQQPTGACCFASGSCAIDTALGCDAAGGEYQGNATTCVPNLCPQPIGACCLAGGICTIETEADCIDADGLYQGDDTLCVPNPCPQPTGACCAAGGVCTIETEADCVDADGEYQGDDTVCDPNPCPQPTGACCTDGVCTIETEVDCVDADGEYQGDGTVCDPNPCPATCLLLGDMNDDGLVDGNDIAGFLRAKLGLPAEPGENQACADFGNGTLEQDTADFVAVLIGS